MSESTVAIIGSGIVGSTIAYLLTQKGIDVNIFEKGPEYPYPHDTQFSEKVYYLHDNTGYEPPDDIKNITVSGNYPRNLNNELSMRVGGSATRWEAITIRMQPNDFKTKSIYGYGTDWPISYDDLEPYYCKAEALLGVSGTDKDNPFSPRRSKPYPLPPFPLSYDDVILAERLKKHGITIHTTPQARTREDYEDRLSCVNYGVCRYCPIGARYSPNYHLLMSTKTGLCKVYTNTSVRRILTDKSGRAQLVVYRPNGTSEDREHRAKVIIVAAGAIESARLLLLSRNSQYPDGLGNNNGNVGKHLMFHHVWVGYMRYKDYLFPGRFGGRTAECHQFINPDGRGKHGGVKITMPSSHGVDVKSTAYKSKTASEIIESMKKLRHQRIFSFASESIASNNNYIGLSEQRDRFGDPYAHVNYKSSDFNYETYQFAKKLFNRLFEATNAIDADFSDADNYHSGAHHMGGVQMGHSLEDSVVNQFGKVHTIANLFVIGGSNFVSTSSVNPTLTITSLAIRSTEYLLDQIL